MPFVMNAQSTISFEDLTLTQDSFWNGSDSTGFFNSGGAKFGNSYNSDYPGYEFWSGGYAYSNMRNDSVAGATNIYSAYPAKGAKNSVNYGLFTASYGIEGNIDFGKTVFIDKINVANTTYAYLSMKNGDAFAKKFGNSTNAGGQDDGTNGKDFFFVRVYALDANDTKLDSTDIYLADFRSANASEHFILDTWKEVSLNMSAHQLTFALFSSDNGQYGMNTPGFFAIDEIEFIGNVGVENISKSTISIYPNPTTEQLNISGYTGNVSIYSIDGTLLQTRDVNGNATFDVSNLTNGLYLVVTSNGTAKVLKK